MKLAVVFATVCAVGVGVAVFRVMTVWRREQPALAAARGETSIGVREISEPTGSTPQLDQALLCADMQTTPERLHQHTPEAQVETVNAATPAPLVPAETPAPLQQDSRQQTDTPKAPGEVHWAPEGDSPAALRRLAAAREALAVDPYHPGALRDELAALRALGRFDEAEQSLKRLMAIEPENSELRLDYARHLVREGLWNQALDPLWQVVERQPENLVAWCLLAAAQQTNGHLDDARRSWTRVIELAPDDPAPYANRGQVYLALRDWPAATADLQRSCALDPNQADTTLALAQAYSELGRYKDATECAWSVLQGNPRNVRAMNRLAELAWQTARTDQPPSKSALDEARQWWEKSLALDPDQPAIRARLEALTGESKK